MFPLLALKETVATAPQLTRGAANPLTVEPLANGEEAEVLAFLAARPLHTVVMAGSVRDHGWSAP